MSFFLLFIHVYFAVQLRNFVSATVIVDLSFDFSAVVSLT